MSDNDWIDWNPNIPGPSPVTGARIRHEYGFNSDIGRYYIHRDDAPDSDLVERMAETIQNAQNEELFSELTDMWKDRVRRQARAALAVVREADQS